MAVSTASEPPEAKKSRLRSPVAILPAVHVVEASAFAAVEDAEVVAFELGPRQLVDPDVVARGLLHRRGATSMPVFLSRDPRSPLPCLDHFGCLRAHHRPIPPE